MKESSAARVECVAITRLDFFQGRGCPYVTRQTVDLNEEFRFSEGLSVFIADPTESQVPKILCDRTLCEWDQCPFFKFRVFKGQRFEGCEPRCFNQLPTQLGVHFWPRDFKPFEMWDLQVT